MNDSPLCITLDIDWAPEEIIADVLSLLDEADVRATIFATHDSPQLTSFSCRRNRHAPRFEIGLHPNYRGGFVDADRPLQELKTLYPDAIGGRSHGLCVSSDILAAYVRCGLQYEANIFLVGHEGLKPSARNEDIWSIPCYWSDDNPLCALPPFRIDNLRLDTPGLKVLNFHPIHIYMNTCSQAHYREYRHAMQDVGRVSELINTTDRGIRDLFVDLLEHVAASGRPTYNLNEIHSHYAGLSTSHAPA